MGGATIAMPRIRKLSAHANNRGSTGSASAILRTKNTLPFRNSDVSTTLCFQVDTLYHIARNDTSIKSTRHLNQTQHVRHRRFHKASSKDRGQPLKPHPTLRITLYKVDSVTQASWPEISKIHLSLSWQARLQAACPPQRQHKPRMPSWNMAAEKGRRARAQFGGSACCDAGGDSWVRY